MNIDIIKSKVQNFSECTIEDVEKILKFIVNRCKEKNGIDFDFQIIIE